MKKIRYIIKLLLTKPLPDSWYLKLCFRFYLKQKLNLKNPATFNEKLQWLKLHDRKKEYIELVDKYKVRDYVKNLIGEQYLIPIYGVYNCFDEIDFNKLPNSFVLKCTHDSGSFYICKNKKDIDIHLLKKKYDRHMRRNPYWYGREWPYKSVPPRIICEQLLEEDIYDYKFYCFNGVPQFFYISKGDNTKGTLKMDFYDLDWNKCPFYRKDHDPLEEKPPRPNNFDKMVEVVKTLCQDFIFVRIDLFNVSGKIYFGEFTLTPGSGFTPFSPPIYEKTIGDWIKLPKQ